MAKKKNRHINIARKRAKREQSQKTKRKQLAFQRQRALQTAKSDEEKLQDKIMKGKLLLDEPELENVTFDQDLLRQHTLELLASNLPSLEDEDWADDIESEQAESVDQQDISEKFHCEVLPRLITPDFVSNMSHSLRACETRLRRMGYREKAGIALVARSLFEVADTETLSFHPLVLKVCSRTLEQTLLHPLSVRESPDMVDSVLSDVLKQSQSEDLEDVQGQVSDEEHDVVGSAGDQDEPHELEVQCSGTRGQSEILPADASDHSADSQHETPEAESNRPVPPAISTENLPAKALYKNPNGLEIRNTIELGDGYQVIKDAAQQIEIVHTDQQHYITVTEDRLLLQCPSMAQLEIAMKDIEKLCGESVFYLAKAVEE